MTTQFKELTIVQIYDTWLYNSFLLGNCNCWKSVSGVFEKNWNDVEAEIEVRWIAYWLKINRFSETVILSKFVV